MCDNVIKPWDKFTEKQFVMRFKLSVRELEILDKDRKKILRRLRENQLSQNSYSYKENPTSSRSNSSFTKKNPRMKPPILVVPLDDSRLFCIIQTCNEFENDEENTTLQKQMSTEEVVTVSSFFANKCCSQSVRRKNERNSKKKMSEGKHKCENSPYSQSEENPTSCDDMDNYLNRIKCVPIPNDQINPVKTKACRLKFVLKS